MTKSSGNWLHGHWGGDVTPVAQGPGIAYYEGWVLGGGLYYGYPSYDGSPKTDWLIMCGSNNPTTKFVVNGRSGVGLNGAFVYGGGSAGSGTVCVNCWPDGFGGTTEKSQFGVLEVIIWNRGLSSTELDSVVTPYLRAQLGL